MSIPQAGLEEGKAVIEGSRHSCSGRPCSGDLALTHDASQLPRASLSDSSPSL